MTHQEILSSSSSSWVYGTSGNIKTSGAHLVYRNLNISQKKDYIASFCSESDFLDFSISDRIIGLKSIRSTSELKLILLKIK